MCTVYFSGVNVQTIRTLVAVRNNGTLRIMTMSLRKMVGRLKPAEVAELLIVLAIMLCVCGFIAVAIGVKSGATRNIDEKLLRARAIRAI